MQLNVGTFQRPSKGGVGLLPGNPNRESTRASLAFELSDISAEEASGKGRLAAVNGFWKLDMLLLQ
jgi:hypothetical protein